VFCLIYHCNNFLIFSLIFGISMSDLKRHNFHCPRFCGMHNIELGKGLCS